MWTQICAILCLRIHSLRIFLNVTECSGSVDMFFDTMTFDESARNNGGDETDLWDPKWFE